MPNHVIRDRLWESGKLERCSDAAAAWYPWLYLICNDWGIFEFHPRAIWMSVFRRRPSVSQADVELWLSEYEREGLLIRYHIDDELAFWTGFKGRKPSERRDNEYPDPFTFPEVVKKLQAFGIKAFDGRAVPAPKGATRGRKSRDEGAEGPRQNRGSSDRISSYQETKDLPAAPPPDSEVPTQVHYSVRPVKAWSAEACDDWNTRFGASTAPGGEIGRFLKPLVDNYGWEVVRPAWTYYLRYEKSEFTKPAAFKSKFGEWQSRQQAASPIKPTQGHLDAALRAAGADGRD